uniref:Uncharacterized protein n=1 Tax=Tanacetum cinerariifolium TaxID=118510 RepID=A0A699HZF2_TANCI|nr:hypothetical protein [Tanacetum cinerariifolium]
MAQHVIPAVQLVPQYKPIRRCNNYAVLQSIPCSTECKIVGLILLDHCLSHALTATTDVFDVYLQKFWRMVSKKKKAIQYPRFTKLIIVDLMKKFPIIPKRIEEDYHSIKDDVPLVSVYTTGNVSVRGMPIPDAFLTAEIRETNDFKEYETVFMKTAGESISPRKSLKIMIKQKEIVETNDDDSKDRLEPGSHKKNPKFVVVDDHDDKAEEKQSDDMGSLEIRNEETQTTIPTPPSSPRKILSSDKKIDQELTDIVRFAGCAGVKMKRSLQDRADDIALWEALRCKFKRSSPSNTSCREDDFHSQHDEHQDDDAPPGGGGKSEKEDDFHSQHDEHQDDDAPPGGEEKVKSKKESKRSKSTRGAREENVIDEDEVIPEDETPELIAEFHNLKKRVPTIFDRARMEATLRDSLNNKIFYVQYQRLIFYGPQRNPNEPPRPLYNKDLFFLKYGNTKEKKYILSIHKILAKEFPEPDLEEKINRWVRKEFKTFNEEAREDEKRVLYLVEIVKFCDATLEKVLNEVKLRMFESQMLKKPPLLSDLDQDIMKAYEREIFKRLSHRHQMRKWESFVNGRPILPTIKRL